VSKASDARLIVATHARRRAAVAGGSEATWATFLPLADAAYLALDHHAAAAAFAAAADAAHQLASGAATPEGLSLALTGGDQSSGVALASAAATALASAAAAAAASAPSLGAMGRVGGYQPQALQEPPPPSPPLDPITGTATGPAMADPTQQLAVRESKSRRDSDDWNEASV
jgi:hypothetical protein